MRTCRACRRHIAAAVDLVVSLAPPYCRCCLFPLAGFVTLETFAPEAAETVVGVMEPGSALLARFASDCMYADAERLTVLPRYPTALGFVYHIVRMGCRCIRTSSRHWYLRPEAR